MAKKIVSRHIEISLMDCISICSLNPRYNIMGHGGIVAKIRTGEKRYWLINNGGDTIKHHDWSAVEGVVGLGVFFFDS